MVQKIENKAMGKSDKIQKYEFLGILFFVGIRYTNTKKMGDEGVRNGSGSVLSSSYRFRPIATENILGDLNAMNEGMIENYAKQSQWDRYNPVNRINDNYSPKDYQALRGILSLNWEIVKGLTYHSDLSLNQSWNQNKTWTGAIVNSYMDDNTGEILYAGNAELEKSNKWGLRWSNTLNYDFSLGKAHRFSILAGHEVSDSGGDGLKASGTYYPANFTKENAFAMINQYDGTQGVGQFSSSVSIPGRILSFFSRLNYNLLDRYLLTVTFRADGSSKFSPNNRWGYFPAAALGWRMSEESFLKDVEWLDNLKLRVSYGQVGNDGISSSLWSQTWSATTDVRQQDAVNNRSAEGAGSLRRRGPHHRPEKTGHLPCQSGGTAANGGGPEGWSGRLISSPAPRRPRRAKRVRRSAKPHRKQR